jgi:anti-anti-sigma factor
MQDIEISVKKDQKEFPVSIQLKGYLDSSNSYKLSEIVDDTIKEGFVSMIFDFENLEYLSSAGVSVITETAFNLKNLNSSLKLIKVSQRVMKVLELCGITKLVDILTSEEKAVKSFKSNTGNKDIFPAKIKCPRCSFESGIPNSDIYKCPRCSEIFFVDENLLIKTLDKSLVSEEKKIRVDLWIKADISYVSVIRKFVGSIASKEGFPEESVNDIELAVDEALTNIIEHAYDFDSSKTISVNITSEPDKIIITLIDKGIEWSIDETKDTYSSKGSYRGKGRYLIRKLMDDVKYTNYTGIENKLIITKNKKDIKQFIKLV